MTNRKWINNSNVYDLLLQMNNCIRYKSDSDFCIMDCLAQYDRKCIYSKETKHNDCAGCIQNYLDEEHENQIEKMWGCKI